METPEQMLELSEQTRKFLSGLRDDEHKTLEAIVALPVEDVREGFKLVRDLRIFGRFGKWLILTVISIFIGTVVLYEYILEALGYFRGPNP